MAAAQLGEVVQGGDPASLWNAFDMLMLLVGLVLNAAPVP
jgi:hypothetical protein